MDVFAGSFAICVGILHLGWQQVFHSLVAVHGVSFHLATAEHAQLSHHLQVDSVDETSVQVGRHGIDSDTGTCIECQHISICYYEGLERLKVERNFTQFALLSDSGAGTDEIQTSSAEQGVERIVAGDVDGPTCLVTLLDRYIAAFRLGICVRIYYY